MHVVDLHEARTHLARLIEKAARGEAFIITKAGKPMVKVVPTGANRSNSGVSVFFRVSSKFPMISTEWADSLSMPFSAVTNEGSDRGASA